MEGRLQNKIQTAVSGTESTIKRDTEKILNRKFPSGPLFQTERKARKEPAINTSGEINPKNRHCLRGLNGKYGRWDEILQDILNGKIKIVQNTKQPESETEDEDDDDDEEKPEEKGTPTKVYDTSERNGSYVPIRTSPEEDALQIYTDEETTGENLENQNQIRQSNRNSKKPNRYGSIVYRNVLGLEQPGVINYMYITGNLWNEHKGTPLPEKVQKQSDFFPEENTPPGPSSQN